MAQTNRTPTLKQKPTYNRPQRGDPCSRRCCYRRCPHRRGDAARQLLRAVPPPVPKATALAPHRWDSAAWPPHCPPRGPCQPAGLRPSHSARQAKSNTVPKREKGSARLPGQSPPGLPGAHSCPARPYKGGVSTPLLSGGMAAPRGEGLCRRPCGDRAAPREPHVTLPPPRHGHGLAGSTWRRRCRLAVTRPAFPAGRHVAHVTEIDIVTHILWEVFGQP